MLLPFSGFSQTTETVLPSNYYFEKTYEQFTAKQLYSLDVDKTTAKFNGERGLLFRQIGLYAKPSTKEFALLLFSGDLKNQYLKTKTFESKLVVDDENQSVSPCQVVKKKNSDKLKFEIAAIKLSEAQFLSVLESENVTVTCGVVTIKTDESNLSAFRYVASKLAADSDFSHNFVDDSGSYSDDNGLEIFYGDSQKKVYFSKNCEESSLIPILNLKILVTENEVVKSGYVKGETCTPKTVTSYYSTPATNSAGGSVRVRGYYRKDGTYVNSHTRKRPRKN